MSENVFINETLCPRNKAIRGRCGLLKKEGLILNVATKNGMVRIKLLNSNEYTDVLHEEDITDKFPDFNFPFELQVKIPT